MFLLMDLMTEKTEFVATCSREKLQVKFIRGECFRGNVPDAVLDWLTPKSRHVWNTHQTS